MYTAYYGFREKPFALSPDPRFLYLSASHREVLGHLIYGIEQGEGFIAVTGEVGTGKTTLCRVLMRRLSENTELAFVFNPMLSGEELLRAISIEFGLITEGYSRADLNDQLNQFLLETSRAGRRARDPLAGPATPVRGDRFGTGRSVTRGVLRCPLLRGGSDGGR